MELLKMMKKIDVANQEATKSEKAEEVKLFNDFISVVAERASTSGAMGKQKMEDFFDPNNEVHKLLPVLSNSDLYHNFIGIVLDNFKYKLSIADEFMDLDDCIISAFMSNSNAKAYWEVNLKER